jgi:hypothetical protein
LAERRELLAQADVLHDRAVVLIVKINAHLIAHAACQKHQQAQQARQSPNSSLLTHLSSAFHSWILFQHSAFSIQHS